MKTKTTFTNISRKQLEYIVTNGVKALADTKNFETFALTIETEGDSPIVANNRGGEVIIGIDKATGKDFTAVWYPPKEQSPACKAYLEHKDKEAIYGSSIPTSTV